MTELNIQEVNLTTGKLILMSSFISQNVKWTCLHYYQLLNSMAFFFVRT